MSFNPQSYDTPAERLMLVHLEKQKFPSDYRHICAYPVRRAVAHTYKEDGVKVDEWYDGDAAKATGYRNCAWNKTTTGGVYIQEMVLRGQIDVNTSTPLAGGMPYGTEVRCKPYEVDMQTAKAIYETLSKWDKFCQKHPRRNDAFLPQLLLWAKFLRTDRFVFYKNPVKGDLSIAENFEETDIIGAVEQVTKMLAPFARIEA